MLAKQLGTAQLQCKGSKEKESNRLLKNISNNLIRIAFITTTLEYQVSAEIHRLAVAEVTNTAYTTDKKSFTHFFCQRLLSVRTVCHTFLHTCVQYCL